MKTMLPIRSAKMTGSRTFLLVLMLSLTGMWASQAAGQLTFGEVLYTPPLWADYFVCTVVNISSNKLLITAKIRDESGAQISTNPIAGGCTFANLNPGQACGVIAPSGFVHLAYCSISVVLGSKQDVRGSLYGSKQNALPMVVPAQ